MTNNKKAINSLLNGIQFLIKKELSKSSLDKTLTGIIKNIKDDNLYDISINGYDYTNVPSFFIGLNINDIIKVKVPQGQYSQMYIEGKYNIFNIQELNNKLLELENKNSELIVKVSSLEEQINELKGGNT